MKLFSPQSFHVGLGFSSVCFLIAKVVSYGRQLVLAYNFGISRGLDVYLMSYAITMLVVSSFTVWFDQMAIPRLIQAREKGGENAFREMSASVFSLSIAMGITLCIVLLVLVEPLSWILSKGFSEDERDLVRHMSLFFLPWVLLIFPYNALTAILKSLRLYGAVSISDLSVSILSTLGFLAWHSKLIALPLTLAAGYAMTLIVLVFFARSLTSLWGPLFLENLRPLYHDFKQMLIVNQVVFIHQGFERFYQSFLLPGSIASFNYVYQIMSPLYELLGFDEIFVVPISLSENRIQKLNRLFAGLLLLTTPIAVFIYFESSSIIRILYERGKFGPEATALSSRILQILSFGMVAGTMSTPLVRALQVTHRVLSIAWITAASLLSIIVLNFIFILEMKFDVIGFAWAGVGSIYVCVITEIYLLHRNGVRLHYPSLSKYFLLAFVNSFLGQKIAHLVPMSDPLFIAFLFRSALYGVFLGGVYWLLLRKIKAIIYGASA